MKLIQSEKDFRNWVIAMFTVKGGHIQGHEDRHSTGIPDISAAYDGVDYWLELKYDEFTLTTEHYQRFEYRELTRQQLEWLIRRAEAGDAACGILGCFALRSSLVTNRYVFYMEADAYLGKLWRGNAQMSVGAVMLSPYSMDIKYLTSLPKLVEFIQAARDGRRLYND